MSSSSSAVSEPPAQSTTATRALLPRVGSLLAFAPLGAWTTWHLWENLAAFQGRDAWESRVTAAQPPAIEFATSLVILLPLVLHTIWGVRRIFMVRPNVRRYPNFANIKFVLQRLSALGLLAFIPAHLWLARFQPLIATGHHETFADIADHMRNHPPTLIVYILGVLGVAYHLANGLATGGMTWGFAATPRAMQRMNWISAAYFIVLLAMGWGSMYALWLHGAH